MLTNRGASRHARRRPTMRDALSGRSGDGAPEPPSTPPGPPPAPDPPIPPRPTPPTHPGATRAGRHGRPPRPNALNDPSHHTRETHSDAFATILRTRRTCPSGPSPQPSRSTSSKPPPNNLPRRHDQNPADFRTDTGRSRDWPGPVRVGPGLRNASSARRSPPRLAPCEPSATQSACARFLRAHLAQCDLR